jgi:predicted Rossmann fold flavoprotein
METKRFSGIVIGGGPAGMMAALSMRRNHPETHVAIIEKTFELGRKLLVSGAGRGNLTNINLTGDVTRYYHGKNDLITSIFSQFGFDRIRSFFEELGIPLYEEGKTNRGKMFPKIDSAKTVRDILVRELEIAGVTFFCDTTVTQLQKSESHWKIQTNDRIFEAENIILAGGGKTYPALGSDGSGYDLARQLGHTISVAVPSAVPLVSKNQLSHFLQGEKMNMKITAVISGKNQTSSVGDVVFAQYGISGPAVFDVSRDISVRIHREGKTDTKVVLSFFPDMTDETLRDTLESRIRKYPQRPVAELLWGLLTTKASGAVCAVAKLPKEKKAGELSHDEKESLIQILLHTELQIDDTRGWNEAEFTAGGVDTNEINIRTLESTKAANVYFAGEILDVDGQVGGYNLSWAWGSGWVAGQLQ